MSANENILLTGASGFIGKRLLDYLESINVYPRVVLNKSDLDYKNKVFLDLSKDKIKNDIFNEIDSVIHLAGQAHDVSGRNSSSYQQLNIKGSLKLAEASIENDVKNFVYISSTKAAQHDFITGKNGNISYAESKFITENLLKDLCKGTGMLLTILRPSLVYGPNAKGNVKLMQKAISQGWFPPLPKTNNKKSMVHVDDLSRVIYFLLKNNINNGKTFIATDGIEYSSYDIYSILCGIVNKKVPSWSIPIQIFSFLSSLSPYLSNRIDKLLSDDYHSSKDLCNLGFTPMFTLKDINEKMF